MSTLTSESIKKTLLKDDPYLKFVKENGLNPDDQRTKSLYLFQVGEKEVKRIENLRMALAEKEYERIAADKRDHLVEELEGIKQKIYYDTDFTVLTTEHFYPKYKKLEDVDIDTELLTTDTLKVKKSLFETLRRKPKEPKVFNNFDTDAISIVNTLKQKREDQAKKSDTLATIPEYPELTVKRPIASTHSPVNYLLLHNIITKPSHPKLKVGESKMKEKVKYVPPTNPTLSSSTKSMDTTTYMLTTKMTKSPRTFFTNQNFITERTSTLRSTEVPRFKPKSSANTSRNNVGITILALLSLLAVLPIVFVKQGDKSFKVHKELALDFLESNTAVYIQFTKTMDTGWLVYQDRASDRKFIIGDDLKKLGVYGLFSYLIKSPNKESNVYELYEKSPINNQYIFHQNVEIRFIY